MKRAAELALVGVLSLSPIVVAQTAPPPPGPPWLCKKPMRAADFAGGQKARDLSHVRPLVRGKRARQRYDEGMLGKPPSAQEAALPSFVDAARARAWTEHPGETLDRVAARAWGADRWIIIAVGRSDVVRYGLDVRLALLEVTSAGTSQPVIKRLARTTQPLAPRPQFGLLPGDFWPTTCQDDPCADSLEIERPEDVALDLAAYEIAPGERAFGVRTTWSEAYGGGYGSFEALSLFRADADRLVPILDLPVGVQRMLAGDWNADSTRQHELFEADLLVRMVPSAGGRAAVALAPRGGKPKRFVWDQALGGYRCGGP